MNMQPIIQSLSFEDFKKMLKVCRSHAERFELQLARIDPMVEYTIHLPAPPEENIQ